MDNSWPHDFPWNTLLQEEPLESFPLPEELLGLDLELSSFFDPSYWPDDQSRCYETRTHSMDVEDNFADLSQIDQYAMQNSFHDPVEATAIQSGSSSLPRSDSSQTLTTPLTQPGFNDYLHEFEGVPNQPPQRRRRKCFSPVRKKEVDQLRKIGACIRCKLTKSSCKLDRPCSACIKACGNTKLGKALCIRQKMLDVRFTSDLWHRKSDLEWLRKKVIPLEGPIRILTIFLYACDLDPTGPDSRYEANLGWRPGGMTSTWRETLGLNIKVQAFCPRKGSEDSHALNVYNSDTLRTTPIPGEYYAIAADSLPTLQELETWAFQTMMSFRAVALFGGLRASFISFAQHYYQTKPDLPLKTLVQESVRLSALHGIWCRALTLGREDREQPYSFASQAVHTQLAIIVTNGIVDLEIDILSALHKRLFGPKGLGKQNMLPIWTCLWLLILTYRETVDLWYSQTHKKEGLPQLAKHMYDMLVSIYSALFRPSSPMSRNWLTDRDLFGDRINLIKYMGVLKSEVQIFHKNDDQRHPKDVLLRSLIVEREMKLSRKASQSTKKLPDGLTEKHYSSLVSPAAEANCFYSL